MAQDPRKKANEYLKQHKMKEIFEELGTLLLYYRPEVPADFLVQQLKLMKNAKKERNPFPFFNSTDISTMFGMFDITNQGYITLVQYTQALKSLGIDSPTVGFPDYLKKVDRDMFIRSVTQELRNNAPTM